MTQPISPSNTSSVQLGDIYYTVFRHKWKIVICALVGIGAAFAVYKFLPSPFISDARLLIRFVISEGRSVGPSDDAVAKSPDVRGETIINSELQILTSRDLAEIVARNVGPEKILAATNGGNSVAHAASVVQSGLSVEAPTRSSTLILRFEHSREDVVQPVLREIVSTYLKRHREIHQASGMAGDFIAQETDQLRARLAQTEEELRKATNKAGIISLEDYKRTSGEQLARLRQQIFDLQAELAERTSMFNELNKDRTASGAEAEKAAPPPPQEKVAAYQKLVSRLAQLRQREQDLLAHFREESPRVVDVRSQITDVEEQKTSLETEFPALSRIRVVTPTANPQANPNDPVTEAARINALQARLKTLNTQLEEMRAESTKVDQLEISILELQRRKALEENNYRYYSEALEQSRIKEAMGEGRVSNISVVQTPTPPRIAGTKPLQIAGGLAIGGLVLGLAWAFVIELFLDHSVRRPTDVERILQLPLFLSIPRFNRKQLTAPAAPVPALPAPESGPPEPDAKPALTPPNGELALAPYYQTLRDRLIDYFGSINLVHKPKLVAVTGLGKDTGVTTLAAGLARSFSEIGEGNVLLVDMTQGQGSAQQFHKGTPVDIDQLLDTKGSAFVRSHLYVVTESSSSERLAKGMPQRFNQLIPKLKASDFDYIIFDMPPVSQISITPRLANFMDMMLLVLESEKADRDLAQKASDLLAKSKTPVGVVLNKNKSYVPARLHQEREFVLGM